jgi:hypothetical protein
MPSAPIPPNEGARLAALRRFNVLDSAPEEAFDDLTEIASRICGVPIALVSLIDENRQWFKSRVGLDATETPRDLAFCGYCILRETVMVVPDATKDVRFSENPLVTNDPAIRFYAGAPLIDREGFRLGTLCVIDRRPREFSVNEAEILQLLAKRVVHQMELRKIAHDLSVALKNVATLEELLPICSHCKSIRDDQGYWNRMENYFKEKSGTDFTHGICPDCSKAHYGVDCEDLKPIPDRAENSVEIELPS